MNFKACIIDMMLHCLQQLHTDLVPSTPDSARVIGVVVARAVLNFPV